MLLVWLLAEVSNNENIYELFKKGRLMAKAKKMQVEKREKSATATYLYIFLLPMFLSTVLSLFSANYSSFTLKLIAFFMLLGSIKLIDIGLENEKEYKKSTIAIAPKVKYKLLGTIALTITILFLSYIVDGFSLINSIFTSIVGGFGLFAYYGSDPVGNKLPKGSGVNYEKLIKDIKEAQEKLKSIESSRDKIEDLELKSAISKATKRAEDILETIKKDPKDIRIARKFMVVYLDGVKDVIDKYNSIESHTIDDSFRQRLIELLNEASARFDRELDRLKSNEVFDLDVQIDALKQQLKE